MNRNFDVPYGTISCVSVASVSVQNAFPSFSSESPQRLPSHTTDVPLLFSSHTTDVPLLFPSDQTSLSVPSKLPSDEQQTPTPSDPRKHPSSHNPFVPCLLPYLSRGIQSGNRAHPNLNYRSYSSSRFDYLLVPFRRCHNQVSNEEKEVPRYVLNENEVTRYVSNLKESNINLTSTEKNYSKCFQENNQGYLICFLKNVSHYLSILNSHIQSMECQNPYDGLLTIRLKFTDPYPLCSDIEILSLGVMKLLLKYVYIQKMDYGKFTISYTMDSPYSERISFTIDSALDLKNSNGDLKPSLGLYTTLVERMLKQSEIYESSFIYDIFLRVYYQNDDDKIIHIPRMGLSNEAVDKQLLELWKSQDFISVPGYPPQVESFRQKRKIESLITQAKKMNGKKRSFIVADLETIMQVVQKDDKDVNDVSSSPDESMDVSNKGETIKHEVSKHVPYAAGFLVIDPNLLTDADLRSIPDHQYETYFSEDFIHLDSFQKRSDYMMIRFIEQISYVAFHRKIKTIYFHNMGRFDGILLITYYLRFFKEKYDLSVLMRNNGLYQLTISSKKHKKSQTYHYHDSLKILPGKLADLGKAICPELGDKGSIAHEDVNLTNLLSMRDELLKYMKQDILILGGIMFKTQANYCSNYTIDITELLTISSLALLIFRMKYYNSKVFPIYIPTRNEDNFMRQGYYGGHSDVYIPEGSGLKYYDVNSLYPFIMKSYPMPSGKPVWHRSFKGQKLKDLFGFIRASVNCPSDMERPFLPKKENEVLRFPTGSWVGVYFSEELKYAESIGYTITPLYGYLYKKNEKMESPFKSFIDDLFEKRSEAKSRGDTAMSFVLKTVMNSLYGRFGISPKSLVTEIFNKKRYDSVIKQEAIKLEYGASLEGDSYLVRYYVNTNKTDNSQWNPPRNSAVQLSAAITAYARIYMYPFISRSDCYYTDTDSVVLKDPLPDEMISSSELGKFKLEYEDANGIFLASKNYLLRDSQGEILSLKHKGAGKDLVSSKWYEEQYLEPDKVEIKEVHNSFLVDHQNMQVKDYHYQLKLGSSIYNKRNAVFEPNEKGVSTWVGTKPFHRHFIDDKDQDLIDLYYSYDKIKELEKEKHESAKRVDELKKEKHESAKRVDELKKEKHESAKRIDELKNLLSAKRKK